MPDHNLLWCGSFTDPSGYGEASRNYVMALDASGDVNLKIRPRSFWNGDSLDLSRVWQDLQRMHRNDFGPEFGPEGHYVSVQHLTPENWRIFPRPCDYHVGMTCFETDGLPAEWQQPMRSVDEIWTHSFWGAEIFREQGILRPIHVIPHGVDVDRFNPNVEPLNELRGGSFKDQFLFGANFDWTERKNPAALLKAYFSAFKREDDVALVLKTYDQYGRGPNFIKNYIEGVRSQVGLTKESSPPVILITDMMAPDQVPHFYASLDAYVLPSRGEGASLTHMEAMATGLPTIGVAWGGNTEFMDGYNSVLIRDFKLVDVTAEMAGPQRQYVGQRWAECEVEVLAASMRGLYEDREHCRRLGERAAATMGMFTWRRVAGQIVTRLQSIK
jgi:glycosyltransferase involved in cell wall biosynthesis